MLVPGRNKIKPVISNECVFIAFDSIAQLSVSRIQSKKPHGLLLVSQGGFPLETISAHFRKQLHRVVVCVSFFAVSKADLCLRKKK